MFKKYSPCLVELMSKRFLEKKSQKWLFFGCKSWKLIFKNKKEYIGIN